MHRIAMILADAAPLVACGSNSPEVEPADLVLRGGRVVTVDEELPEGIPITVVRNKIDLVDEVPGCHNDVVGLSAKTGAGIDALRQRIRDLAGYENQGEGAFTARRRHLDALGRSHEHFRTGSRALEEARAGELLAEELRLSHAALGEITGVVSSDDLLGKIFADFCIGK